MPKSFTPLYGRIDGLARSDPDAPAVIEVESRRRASYSELSLRSKSISSGLLEAGVQGGDFVGICLANGIDLYSVVIAVWRLGATPQLISIRATISESNQALELSHAKILVTDREDLAQTYRSLRCSELEKEIYELAVDVVSPSWKVMSSGGSTGRPKLIVAGQPAAQEVVLPLAKVLGMRKGGTQLVTAPLSHNGPFVFSLLGLLEGATQVVAPRFDPERTLSLIEEYQVEWLYSVPTMMQRMARLDPATKAKYSVDSLKTLFHTAAPCPESVKRAWIEWLGPEAVLELYAGTESQAITLIDGNEWLAHPGSVGRPLTGSFKILLSDGTEAEPNVVGEVYMQPKDPTRPSYEYLGATKKELDGWESLGDMGYLDGDGYLFLVDRQIDMILVGGVNVYPAEIEAVILDHPDVLSCCVVGIPSDDLGQVPHALVQARDPAADSVAGLGDLLRSRLAPYKIPRSIEFVDYSLRDETGKVRRSAVREEVLRRIGAEPTQRGTTL